MVNDVIDQDIFVLDDFFKDHELHVLEQVIASREMQQVVAEAGPFQGKTIVGYVNITDDATAVNFLPFLEQAVL